MREIKISLRSPRQAVKTDVQIERDSPQQALRLESFALHAPFGQHVQRARRQNEQVVAAPFEADDD